MLGAFPVISSNLVLGNGVFGTCDPYDSTKLNNGALNPLGGLFYLQPGEGGLQSSGNGRGSGLWVKYVLYKSTDTTAVKTGPAPVYWTDETYTQVTNIQSESATATVGSVAGWLLPNTTALGSAFTITVLRNGGSGSYVFIGLQGYIASAQGVSGSGVGIAMIGSATAWTPAALANATTAPTSQVLGVGIAAVGGSPYLIDIQATLPIF
jgi:hypothetical protein